MKTLSVTIPLRQLLSRLLQRIQPQRRTVLPDFVFVWYRRGAQRDVGHRTKPHFHSQGGTSESGIGRLEVRLGSKELPGMQKGMGRETATDQIHVSIFKQS